MTQLSANLGATNTLTGERLLAMTLLQQAWQDMTSDNAAVRYDAERFWGNAEWIRPWAEVLDLDVVALTEAVERARQA
jgi:hypothetical protein